MVTHPAAETRRGSLFGRLILAHIPMMADIVVLLLAQ